MNTDRYEELEQRLGRLDLQLSVRGEHLSDERLAEIGTGVDVTDPEATHLSGCDECLEVLMALGEGLEDLSTEQPELSLLMTEPPVARRRLTVTSTLVFLSLAACAMAAAGWYVRGHMESSPPTINQSAVPIPEVKPTIQLPPKAGSIAPVRVASPAAVMEPVKAESKAPSAVAPAAVMDPKASPAVAPAAVIEQVSAESKTANALIESSKADAAGAQNVEVAAPRAASPSRVVSQTKRRSKRTERRPMLSKTPQTDGVGLDRRAGPTAYDRVAVDGAPRGFGQLRLNAKPAARVFIDGTDRGWTPVVDLRLQAGPHDVRLVFQSELAEKREDRFRVLIESEKTWSTVRDNRKASLRK